MSGNENIRTAQIRAGEDAVIASLEKMGLLTANSKVPDLIVGASSSGVDLSAEEQQRLLLAPTEDYPVSIVSADTVTHIGTDLLPPPDPLEPLRKAVHAAWLSEVPDFRKLYDDELLKLLGASAFYELHRRDT